MLSPSRPEFRELTREELAQQRKEERDADALRRKEEREYRISPEGKEEIKIAREKKEDEIKDYVYENFINPERNDISRIEKYVEGILSKNRKKGETKSTLGRTLKKYGLEDKSLPEIKRWLIERTETKYSPSDVRAELDKGNPVFVGDYRDVTGG